jgi:uncharacterized beta-barrel protein YwiB (DUF1934 family)
LKENVIIKMFSVQYENGEKTESELMTKGVMKHKGTLSSLSYEDSEATGFEGSITSVIAKGKDYVSIVRNGTANSNLILETGRKHHCYYSTPFGSVNVGISTDKIENCLNENGGTIYMKYTIDVNSAFVSDNEIKLIVTKIDE